MKTTFLQTGILASVVGCASAGLTSFLLLAPEPGGRGPDLLAERAVPEASGRGGETGHDDELLARIEALSEASRELRARIEGLERRPVAEARVPVVAEEARPLLLPQPEAAVRPELGLPSEVLLERVEEALGRIREEERAEEERRDEERRAERLEERLARLSDELGLAPHQVRDLRTLWLAQEQGRDELRRALEDSGDRDAYREARKDQRKANDEALARILTPAQLEDYRKREQQRDAAQTRDRTRGRGGRGASDR